MRNIVLIALATASITQSAAAQDLSSYTQSLTSCIANLDGVAAAEQAFDRASVCAIDNTAQFIFDRSADYFGQRGKQLFGQGFHIQQSLQYSAAAGDKVRGDLDAVIPLRMGVAADSLPSGALFLQNGISRWTDQHGFDRSDTRVGLVRRFQADNANLFGISAALQQNLERGHERRVFGLDYVGRFGKGYVNHYAAQTDWLAGRNGFQERAIGGKEIAPPCCLFSASGFQERAIGGKEIGVSLAPTTAIKLDLSVGDWDSQTEIGESVIRNRVAVAWQPHPYWRFSGDYSDGNQVDAHKSMRIAFVKPLGKHRAKAQWVGFGVARNEEVQSDDMWRTVASENRIEVVERKVPAREVRSGDVALHFLQDKAATGTTIRIQASVAAPAANELRVLVQLSPGGGENPAVAGEDFPVAPIVIVIAQGSTAGVVQVAIPINPEIKSERRLRAEIIKVGGQA